MNRKDFLKLGGLSGLGLAESGLLGKLMERHKETTSPDLPAFIREKENHRIQQFNMSGYAAPKIDTIRVGDIGIGKRGASHLGTLTAIEGVEIKAVCDIVTERAEAGKNQLEGTDHNPTVYGGNIDEWKKVCERNDIDLIVIATPWYMHAEQAIYAMELGKHVASEVPAAATVEECYKLVETSERTRRHCMMMENYSYMSFQLLTLNMARKGFFGEIVHGEGAYNTSKIENNFSKTRYWNQWWLKQYASRKGNIYPTHGLGPVCQIMNINYGDRLDYLVSVESDDFIMKEKANELAMTDDAFKPFVDIDFRGNMNITTIRTKKGKTIMLQHDASTPSPHNLIHGIHGTGGSIIRSATTTFCNRRS